MYNNNSTASFAASCPMQILIAARAGPLLWAPCIASRLINIDRLLALAFCALHEGDSELVASRLSCSGSATKGLSDDPLGQFHPTPTEYPAECFSRVQAYASIDHSGGLCYMLNLLG